MTQTDDKSTKRRIPLGEKFMNKKVNDILYGYLQSISTYRAEGDIRYIYKDGINFSEIERALKGEFKRRTLANNFNYLINIGFIEEGTVKDIYGQELKAYILPYEQDSIYKLIPLETLKFLVNTTNASVIATYVYLLNKWEWKGRDYIFTSKELINNCLGIKSVTNQRDYDRIRDILSCLQNNELIECIEFFIKKDNHVIPQKRLVKVNKYPKIPF